MYMHLSLQHDFYRVHAASIRLLAKLNATFVSIVSFCPSMNTSVYACSQQHTSTYNRMKTITNRKAAVFLKSNQLFQLRHHFECHVSVMWLSWNVMVSSTELCLQTIIESSHRVVYHHYVISLLYRLLYHLQWCRKCEKSDIVSWYTRFLTFAICCSSIFWSFKYGLLIAIAVIMAVIRSTISDLKNVRAQTTHNQTHNVILQVVSFSHHCLYSSFLVSSLFVPDISSTFQ